MKDTYTSNIQKAITEQVKKKMLMITEIGIKVSGNSDH